MNTPTRAAAHRWLDAHVGQDLSTRQTAASGMVWEPGVRTLSKRGKVTWTLDGSEVRLTASHVVLDITDDLLLLEWQDDDGVRIHVTAYRPVPQPGIDYEVAVCCVCGEIEHSPSQLAECIDSAIGPRDDDR